MPTYDEDDPKLVGYIPLQDLMIKDSDRSSRRIRDMPHGLHKEDASIFPLVMEFGSVEVNTPSINKIALLVNKGYDTLNIEDIKIVGDFSVTTDCNSSLKPGESCHISVQFNPRNEGEYTGGVYVNTQDASGDHFIELSGIGQIIET